jgi:disulfide bond formation protein DsbB
VLTSIFSHRRFPAPFLGLGCGVVLATAYAFEYFAHLPPCILCLYQRVPYAIVIFLMLLAMIFHPHKQISRALFVISSLVLLTGAGLAVFHVGVEQHIWAGTSECGNVISADSIASLREQLLAQPIIRCDKIAWSLFGVSMAGYNFLISISLALFSMVIVFRRN